MQLWRLVDIRRLKVKRKKPLRNVRMNKANIIISKTQHSLLGITISFLASLPLIFYCSRFEQSRCLSPPPTHTFSFTFSFDWTVNNCTVRSKVSWKIRRFVQLIFLDCVTLGTAEDLTGQFTLGCSVCCFLKAEAQFVHSFNAVIIT
jgi:hypothetical protein